MSDKGISINKLYKGNGDVVDKEAIVLNDMQKKEKKSNLPPVKTTEINI